MSFEHDPDYLQAVGDLVIQWGRLESRFRNPERTRDSKVPIVDVRAVSLATGISERQVDDARRVRNDASHSDRPPPPLGKVKEALGVVEMVWRALDGQPAEATSLIPITGTLTLPPSEGVEPPTTYPNPRGDNHWDNDAVHWLLEKPDVAERFKRGPLMECLRRQPGRLRREPHRVEQAAELAKRHGVIQRREFDPKTGKDMVRLYRTDPDRPCYPGTPPSEAV